MFWSLAVSPSGLAALERPLCGIESAELNVAEGSGHAARPPASRGSYAAHSSRERFDGGGQAWSLALKTQFGHKQASAKGCLRGARRRVDLRRCPSGSRRSAL